MASPILFLNAVVFDINVKENKNTCMDQSPLLIVDDFDLKLKQPPPHKCVNHSMCSKLSLATVILYWQPRIKKIGS